LSTKFVNEKPLAIWLTLPPAVRNAAIFVVLCVSLVKVDTLVEGGYSDIFLKREAFLDIVSYAHRDRIVFMSSFSLAVVRLQFIANREVLIFFSNRFVYERRQWIMCVKAGVFTYSSSNRIVRHGLDLQQLQKIGLGVVCVVAPVSDSSSDKMR